MAKKPPKTAAREGAPYDTSVVTEPIAICFASVFEPALELDGKTYKYRCTPLIPKKDKTTRARCDAAIQEAIRRGIEKGVFPKARVPSLSLPFRDGDEEIEQGKKGEEFKGMVFFSAKSDNKPQVLDMRGQEIIDPDEVYSGAICRLDLNFYAFNRKGNVGIAVGLSNVLKVEDGPRMDGRRSASQAFGDFIESEHVEDDEGAF